MCVTPGATQYLYSGEGFSGKIYKFDTAQVIYKGDSSTWTVEQITVK